MLLNHWFSLEKSVANCLMVSISFAYFLMNGKESKPPVRVICPYCDKDAVLVKDTEVYRRSYGGMVWFCKPCMAWVGCHRNSKDHKPLGRLANAELRRWKQNAHRVFDPMWKAKIRRDECSKHKARSAGYRWLSEQLGISHKECHIGMFDVALCVATVEVCTPPYGRKNKSVPKEEPVSKEDGSSRFETMC